MNILYLTNTRFTTAPYRDASTRYRCFHYAEDLRASGHNAEIASIDNLALNQLDNYDVVSMLRPTNSRRLDKILDTCQRLQILTIADFDDLLFSPDHADVSPAVLSQQSAVRPVRTKFQNHLDALRRFSHVTVATEPLKQHVNNMHSGAEVAILPNGLSRYWLGKNGHLDRKPATTGKKSLKDGQTDAQTITYLPGSRSHNADFGSIASVLSEFLDNQPQLSLHIIGELDFDATVFDTSRLRRTPWVDYTRLPAITKNSLATIAPLEASEFNQCKSHIKFIESAAFGTPVIMSAIPDVTQHSPIDGLFTAKNTTDWKMGLHQLLETSDHLARRDKLQQYARTHCMNHYNLSDYLAFIQRGTSRKSDACNTAYAQAS